MNMSNIKLAYKNGTAAHEILNELVETGFDVDYATLRISQALEMKKDEISKMRDEYNNSY
jgi:hypothetical protein